MIAIPVVECTIIGPDGERAPFVLTFYGVSYDEFMVVPGGGNLVYEALHRRGLHGYVASPFFIRRRSYAHIRGNAIPAPPAAESGPPGAADDPAPRPPRDGPPVR